MRRGPHGDHVLGAQQLRLGVNGWIGIGMEDSLRDAVAIANVDEDDSSQVASPVHPAHDERGGPVIGRAELAAGVRALQIAEEV